MTRGMLDLGSPAGFEDLVPILRAHPIPGHRIPRPRGIGSTRLDFAHIRRINESTDRAAALLAAIFEANNG